MEKAYQICVNCVMDTSDSSIIFDDAGVCDHCITFKNKILPKWNPDGTSEDKLNAFSEKIKKENKNHDFDCLIGMSGGIDSSYLVYLATEVLKLRPLVFHVDAGWNSQIAVNNIEKIIEGLGLDLYTEVINWNEMRDLQLSFFKSGVSHIDTPQDHAFFATMYKFASKHNIKNILTGGNYSTECVRNPLEWMYYQSDSVQLKDIHNKFGTVSLSSYPVTDIIWHKFYLPYIRNIKLFRPLDMMKYNKEAAFKTLETRFGYQKYPQKHFESRFTKFYEGYWLPKRFGYDTRRVQFSSLILAGQLSRQPALDELKNPILSEDDVRIEFEYISNKLDISKDELQSYFTAPKKSYKDYKSQSYLYNIGANMLRYLGFERGGKR